MPNIVKFLSREQLQSAQNRLSAPSTVARDAEIQLILERELEKMIKAANFLEALRTRISTQIHGGSSIKVAVDCLPINDHTA
ncbi:hypothetical protein [Rhizobium miluonense]|uniref:Uncharacterized protein n=1 Tax=Rhizobium miluonense TaxID=411945 RepID=A0A1C3V5S5_9HYPH|nr:hypothetical protein [Rhizobium miluonense]SCB23122.1 hypothetical protein GA0061102_100931 [Rhizobium miluonense]